MRLIPYQCQSHKRHVRFFCIKLDVTKPAPRCCIVLWREPEHRHQLVGKFEQWQLFADLRDVAETCRSWKGYCRATPQRILLRCAAVPQWILAEQANIWIFRRRWRWHRPAEHHAEQLALAGGKPWTRQVHAQAAAAPHAGGCRAIGGRLPAECWHRVQDARRCRWCRVEDITRDRLTRAGERARLRCKRWRKIFAKARCGNDPVRYAAIFGVAKRVGRWCRKAAPARHTAVKRQQPLVAQTVWHFVRVLEVALLRGYVERQAKDC